MPDPPATLSLIASGDLSKRFHSSQCHRNVPFSLKLWYSRNKELFQGHSQAVKEKFGRAEHSFLPPLADIIMLRLADTGSLRLSNEFSGNLTYECAFVCTYNHHS